MARNTGSKFRKLAVQAARLADSKKAENVKIYHIAESSTLADYAVLATVDSPPQLETVEYEITKKFKEGGVFRLHRDGMESGVWRVVDYGGLLVHIVTAQAREFYGLDRIYHLAKEVRWLARRPAAPAAAKRRAPRRAGARARK